jgi:hypothetical protein
VRVLAVRARAREPRVCELLALAAAADSSYEADG